MCVVPRIKEFSRPKINMAPDKYSLLACTRGVTRREKTHYDTGLAYQSNGKLYNVDRKIIVHIYRACSLIQSAAHVHRAIVISHHSQRHHNPKYAHPYCICRRSNCLYFDCEMRNLRIVRMYSQLQYKHISEDSRPIKASCHP